MLLFDSIYNYRFIKEVKFSKDCYNFIVFRSQKLMLLFDSIYNYRFIKEVKFSKDGLRNRKIIALST